MGSGEDLSSRLTPEVYDLAMRAINEGVYDWDVSQGKVYYSERVEQAVGVRASLHGTPQEWAARIHPDDRAAYDAAMLAHFKRASARFEHDYRYRAGDDSWRWARQHGIALFDASGRAVRMVGSTGDITELKRTEEALRASEERYVLATNAATDGIYEWDLDAGRLLLSERAKTVFAIAGEQLTPASWKERVHPADMPGYRAALTDHFEGGAPVFEHEYRVSDGNGYRWVFDRGIAVRDAAGRAVRLVGAMRDVTERKQAEMELRRARDEAEAATRAKSDFLSAMSHELRTPLNSIIGFSEVLRERIFGDLNAKQDEYVQDIHSSGLHPLSLINDMLDLAKVEAGRMELDVSEFDACAALAHALVLVRERAQRHHIELRLDADPRLGAIRADERELKQILLNLLSNAVKFTPDGGRITLAARRLEGSIEVAVKDSGIGIAPQDQDKLFEEFRQVGSDAARKQEGSGLGLALTKKFVELHGGTIGVESQPAIGSTFTFSIPQYASGAVSP